MIRKINFTKMVASGNDFVVVETGNQGSKPRNLKELSRFICDRKYGVGADGLLILEKSRKADIRMQIFNPDGSEPEMCGNGVRSLALYAVSRHQGRQIKIETGAGTIEAKVNRDKVKVKMTEPKGIKLDLPIKIAKRKIKVNFINTGVPHTVIFVEGLNKINVVNIGRQIRNHLRFLPKGTNVDFVQVIDGNNIKLRTYERGVEDETLACGTGAVAAALLFAISACRQAGAYSLSALRRINVHTKSGEVLRVEFKRINRRFKDIWLEGRVKIVYSGVYYV